MGYEGVHHHRGNSRILKSSGAALYAKLGSDDGRWGKWLRVKVIWCAGTTDHERRWSVPPVPACLVMPIVLQKCTNSRARTLMSAALLLHADPLAFWRDPRRLPPSLDNRRHVRVHHRREIQSNQLRNHQPADYRQA